MVALKIHRKIYELPIPNAMNYPKGSSEDLYI